MHDLKRSKRKMYNKKMPKTTQEITNVSTDEVTTDMDELDRGCKNKNNNNCQTCTNQPIEPCGNQQQNPCGGSNKVNSCGNQQPNPCGNQQPNPCGVGPKVGQCGNQQQNPCGVGPKVSQCGNQNKNYHQKHHSPCGPCGPCEPCEAEYDSCVPNPCGSECCNPICPTYTTKNACPVAIEANRIYDAVQFQIFTDGTGPNGETLYYDYEVVEVSGNIPTTGLVKITIDEVCMNYSSLVIDAGIPTVEDFEVEEIEDIAPCDTIFEYSVCPEQNEDCCECDKGQCVSYKERGLSILVNDLVLELRGHCGCTKVVAYAYPATQQLGGGLCRVNVVEFDYNTLASRICCPSSEKSFTLRQSYNTSLTVDCISKAYICAEDCCGCDCDYDDCFELTIPSGIDLICCVEETVSVLVNDNLVVLGVSQGITPRVVDTFANICNFPSCGDN